MQKTSCLEQYPRIFSQQKFTYFSKIFYYPSVDSTNTCAKNKIKEGITPDAIIIAETQTHGRGRFNRQWYSPPGGLYLSLIFQASIPPAQYSIYPLLTAISIHKMLGQYEITSSIKWPNDVLVNNHKIAGILIETITEDTKKPYIICGVGINVNIEFRKFPKDLLQPVTSMSIVKGKEIDIASVANGFIHSFETELNTLSKKGSIEIVQQWKSISDTLGKYVQIVNKNLVVRGTAIDVDNEGFLLVRTVSGKIERITSGDCEYVL